MSPRAGAIAAAIVSCGLMLQPALAQAPADAAKPDSPSAQSPVPSPAPANPTAAPAREPDKAAQPAPAGAPAQPTPVQQPPAAPSVAPGQGPAPTQGTAPSQSQAAPQSATPSPNAAPPANAPPSHAPAPVKESGTPAVVLDSGEADGIIGRSVRSAAGEDMGRIVDVIVSGNSQVRAVVIDFGGFLGVGSRKIAVDWRALHFATDGKQGRVTLALTRNQVRVSPEFKQGEPIVILGLPPSADGAAEPTSAPAPAPAPNGAKPAGQ